MVLEEKGEIKMNNGAMVTSSRIQSVKSESEYDLIVQVNEFLLEYGADDIINIQYVYGNIWYTAYIHYKL